MPKGKPEFSRRIDFVATQEQYEQVIAISYMRSGKLGKYAPTCRAILKIGLETFLSSMTGKEREEYEAILSKVRLSERIEQEILSER